MIWFGFGLTVIDKAVIPAAGIGSRLLPVTKEMPKEMLPIFCKSQQNATCLKPVLHVIFEMLVDSGARNFCVVVGRGKRAVEDYFTVDDEFLDSLSATSSAELASELATFYDRIRKSSIAFVNQQGSAGFGAAVLCSENFVGHDPFLLHAGDDLVMSQDGGHIARLKNAFSSLNADATFLVEHTQYPEKYGVIRATSLKTDLFEVHELVEKPRAPPSDLGVIAIYILRPIVFDYLRKVKPDRRKEIQLADAIQGMVRDGRRVFAVGLRSGEKRVDIGSPETYRDALRLVF